MTVDELIEELQKYQKDGYGQTQVVIWETFWNKEPNLTTVENIYFKQWKDGYTGYYKVDLEEKLLVLGR